MKAGVAQQRSLLELAKLDAELTRIAHRATHLPQRAAYQQVQAEHNAANDRMAALRIAAEDLDGQVSRFESEIDAVRKRGDRDRSLLTSGATDAKQLADLQHELDSLQRRQASLEDALLEVLERREELQAQQTRRVAGAPSVAGRPGRRPAGFGRGTCRNRPSPAPTFIATRHADGDT